MPIIQPYSFVDFWDWLDANADELAKMAGVSQQQGIKAALREIAKATGSDWNIMMQILVTISSNRLLPLFTSNPAWFSEIATIAQRHTNAAFYALNTVVISEFMGKKPDELKKLFSDIIDCVSKFAFPEAVDSALLSLSNENITTIFIEKNALLVSSFSQIMESSQKFAPPVFQAISDANISELFAMNPNIILSAYSKVAEVSNREAAAIFLLALRTRKLFELFKRNPEQLVMSFTDLAKACSPNSSAIFYLLRKQRFVYMLEMNPESLISSLKAFIEAADVGARDVVPLLFDERVEERFVSDPVALGKSFNSLILVAGKGASKAIPLLNSGSLLDVFLENPERVIGLFSSIAKASGEYADAAFGLLANPKMTSMLEINPDSMVQKLSILSASCGDSTPIIFKFLAKEGVTASFEQDPDRMVDFISVIGKTAEGRKGMFALFANPKFIQGFESWPEQVMENLEKITNSAGSYIGDVFILLSKNRLAQAITELVSGEHLATCLVNLVNNSGKDTPMVLRLFESDEFTKRFINDPYKEEQIVSHLRSFVGKEFAKGLEVLNDPEVAPVFAEDPSVLVTTRFRAYMDNATAIQGISASDALEAIMSGKKVKELFIDYVRQEFHEEGDPNILKNSLLPALIDYIEKKKR
jgi:hypothetical protein